MISEMTSRVPRGFWIHRIKRNYRRHFQIWDFVFSVLISAIIIYVFENRLRSLLIGIRPQVYSTIASLAGAFLGFVLATVSIVLLAAESPNLELVKRSPHYKTLYKQFFSSIFWFFILTFSSLIALIFDKRSDPNEWMTYAVLWLTVLCAFRLGKAVQLLKSIILLLIEPEED